MSDTPIFCKTPFIGEVSWIVVSTENWIWAFHIGSFLDCDNILKEHTASIFRARSDPVGDSMFLCRTGIGDAHKMTLRRWSILVQDNDLYIYVFVNDSVLPFVNDK